jgi:hypothetical protein
MSTIAVIKKTNHGQADRIFRGVYGTLTPSADPAAPASFRLAPEFRPISVLFSYLDQGTAPVQPDEVQSFEVPDDMAGGISNQLMLELESRWANMYQTVAPAASGMLNAMIQGESRQVATAIAAHFVSRGLSRWSVPVSAVLTTSEDGADLGSDAALLAALDTKSATDIVLLDQPTTRCVEAPEALAEMVVADAEAAQTPAWGAFEGVEASVTGSMVVVAGSAEAARAIAATMLQIQSQEAQTNGPVFSLTVKPTALVSVRNRELYAMDGADMDHEDSTSSFAERNA